MASQLPPIKDQPGIATLPLPALGVLDRIRLPGFLQRYPALYARHRHGRNLMFISLIAAGLVSTWLLIGAFFVPTNLKLSFGSATCTFNPILLPELTRHRSDGTFSTQHSETVSIAGYPLFSHKTCISLQSAPEPETAETIALAPLGLPLLQKRITVEVGDFPDATPLISSDQRVSATGAYEFELSETDKIFEYRLLANGAHSDCIVSESEISCPLSDLGLAPGSSYETTLERLFEGEPVEAVATTGLTTLDPVIVQSTSIAAESTVFDAPTGLSIVVNKQIDSVGEAKLERIDPAGEPIAANVSFEGASVQIAFAEALPRETTFSLTLSQITADDGSQLLGPFTLRFRTSGGPVVTGASIGSFKVASNANIVLTFDSSLKPGQNFAGFITVDAGGVVSASVTASGNRLTINPGTDLPRCRNFTVRVAEGLVNEHGIGGGKAWSYNSRTICQSAFSIGSSVKGRSIMAYRFGSGSSRIIYVGGMHGNEKSSVHTLNGWIDYLELNADKLPANRSIIIVPNHNPDGYASSRRTNINNVDLNRNFPSNDWQTAVQMPGNQFLPNGGGMSPLDQPESAALASFIQSQNPRLVLTYHAVAKVVISNDAGDSIGLAQKYAADSGYAFTSNASSGGTFEYATTGEFEDWLADKENIPGILVELSSMSSNQFSSHRSAMWNVAQIP